VQQINRKTSVVRTLLERDDWHPRLLHGSDYPLPGIPVLTRAPRLADAGLLDAAAVPVLAAIREHNPLLFDFVLKRSLAAGGRRWPAAVFETRRHFGIAR
jgi:mannonate dehydratase